MMSRYESLARQMHPSTIGQGRLIELNKKIIGLVDEAIAAEEATCVGCGKEIDGLKWGVGDKSCGYFKMRSFPYHEACLPAAPKETGQADDAR